jgi:hypothetical protein
VARSRRPWARIAARGGALGASAAMLLGLALVLERDDKTAGVASMFVGLAGLALSALALARPREPPPSRPWSLTLSGWTGPPRRSRRRSRSNGRPRPGCGPCTGPRHWKTEPHGSPPCTPRNERSHLSSPHASSSADSALSCDAGRHSGTRFCSRVRRPDRRPGRAGGVSSGRRCSQESPALDRHFRDTVAVSALRVPDFGGIHGSAGLLPLVCLRSRPLGVARRRVVASIRGGSGGVGPDVGEHAAAVPAREGPYEP